MAAAALKAQGADRIIASLMRSDEGIEQHGRYTDFHLRSTPTAGNTGPLTGVHLLITRPVMPASHGELVSPRLARRPTCSHHHHRTTGRRRAACRCARRFALLLRGDLCQPERCRDDAGAAGCSRAANCRSACMFMRRPGTAEELAARGVEAVEIPESSFDSEGCWHYLPAGGSVNGKRIVIFRGDDGRELLREALTARGATVSAVTAYHRRAPTRHRLVCSNCYAAAVAQCDLGDEQRRHFTSGTAGAGRRSPGSAVQLAGAGEPPRIAATARAAGFTRVIETPAGDAGLIATLLQRADSELPIIDICCSTVFRETDVKARNRRHRPLPAFFAKPLHENFTVHDLHGAADARRAAR